MKTQTETKTIIEVYDPAMCCSTGVCGPDVDDELADFANDVKWLKSQGIEVKRYNLGQEPEEFKMCVPVLTRLQKEGSDVLPIILVNGEMVSEGGYPDRSTLKELSGLNSPKDEATVSEQPNNQTSKPLYNEKVDILVAIGSAVASGSDSILREMFAKGKEAGSSQDDMAKAMQSGLNVRQVPLSEIIETANKLLGVPSNGCVSGSGCC
jgi:alkylhydroperoxidase/carboxymuconolactone decarboxylase family protein YurZ